MADLANLPCPHPRTQFPTNEEVLLGNSVIKELDQDIELLQVELIRLQTRLESLQQKRANYASYFSPLRRLPTEIMSEIIDICITNGVDIMTIAGVCARLRDVTLGMTTIWSKISLRPRVITSNEDELYMLRCKHCRELESFLRCRHCYGSEEVSYSF
jgi:hypothetical protein